MATLNEIAQQCSVSKSTVSRALKDDPQISEATRLKIKQAADELGFRPRTYSAAKKSGKISNNLVALLINCNNMPVTNYIIHAVSTALAKQNYELIVLNTEDNFRNEIRMLNSVKDIVQGIIISPAQNYDEYYKKMMTDILKNIPIVSIIRSSEISSIDSVTTNSFPAFRQAVQLLIDNRHKNIALFVSKLQRKTSFGKLSAYVQCMEENNIPVNNEFVVYSKFNEALAQSQAVKLLTAHPEITAIITSNSGISRGCLAAFDELGLKYPENIAIIGYGNDILFENSNIRMTSIEDPHTVMGNQAAALLMDQMHNYRYDSKRNGIQVSLAPRICIRGSEKYPSKPLHKIKSK